MCVVCTEQEIFFCHLAASIHVHDENIRIIFNSAFCVRESERERENLNDFVCSTFSPVVDTFGMCFIFAQNKLNEWKKTVK